MHQVAQGVVDQEEGEDLLLDTARVLGSQDQTGPALVGLDLIQRGLDLPPLGIELGGWRGPWVEDAGDQPIDRGVAAGATEGVLDDADLDRVGVAVLVPGCEDLREVGAVLQRGQDGQDGIALGAPQQIGAGRGRRPPQVETAKATVAQQEHPRRQGREQLLGERGLVDAQRCDLGGENGVGAALDQCGDPCLRIRTAPLSPTGPRPAEELRVRRGVGKVEGGSVDCDQTPRAKPGPVRLRSGHWLADPGEQGSQRLRANRRRARPIAAVVGTRQAFCQRRSLSSPWVSRRATSS